MLKKPNILRRTRLLKKQNICINTRIGTKYPLRQPDNSMQIKLLQQLPLQIRLRPLPKQKTIRQHHRSPSPIRLQQIHNQRHKQISRFPRLILLRKIVLNPILLHSPKRWIRNNDIHPIPRTIIPKRTTQRIIVTNIRRHINPMQHQISHRQHMGQRLLLHTMNIVLQRFTIDRRLQFRLQIFNRIRQKTTRPTSRIKNLLPQLRIQNIHHKLSHSTRRIILPRIPRRLQIRQNLLINIIEQMPIA